MAETKTRSIGLRLAQFGDVPAAGGMATTLAQLARTMKGTASFTTEADSETDFYCEEEPSAPVESVSNEAGLKQAKLNFIEWDNAALIAVLGGTESATAESVTVDGKSYSLKKYKAPADMVTVEKSVRLISNNNVVIDIPRAKVTARFVWNMTRTDIAQIELTCKALAPNGTDKSPYQVYKLGTPTS